MSGYCELKSRNAIPIPPAFLNILREELVQPLMDEIKALREEMKGFAMEFRMSSIWSHPQISGGAPMVRGSRVTLEAIHDFIKGGDTIEEVCKDMELPELHAKKAYTEYLKLLKEKTP